MHVTSCIYIQTVSCADVGVQMGEGWLGGICAFELSHTADERSRAVWL